MVKMPSLPALRDICAESAGIDLSTCDHATAQKITRHAMRIFSAASPDHWEKPSSIETEIDGILRDVRKLRQRIVALDGRAKALARQHAERDEAQEITDAIIAASGDKDKILEAVQRFDALSKRPKTEWVDYAALRHLDALDDALRKPVELAIAASPPGAGRRPNRRAYRIALAAAKVFRDLSGTEPTFWNGGSTPFSRMLERIYAAAGIKADIRKPIEAAMHELKPKG